MEKFMQLNAIILAGGLGSRLREVVSDVPKPLAPVNGKPFIEFVLEQLFESKYIKNIYISVGYMGQMIIDHVQTMKIPEGKEIFFSFEKELLGTGGAIKKVITDFNINENENIVIVNGDSYLNFHIDELCSYYWNPKIMATYISNTSRYGLLTLSPSNQMIIGFREKTGFTEGGFINSGYYLLPVKWFKKEEDKFSLEQDVIIHHLPIQTELSYGAFIDIGVPEDYQRAKWLFKYY